MHLTPASKVGTTKDLTGFDRGLTVRASGLPQSKAVLLHALLSLSATSN